MTSIRNTIVQAAQQLSAASASARLDAEILLAYALGCTRKDLILNALESVPDLARNSYQRLLERRMAHEPIAYIVGIQEFWGLPFEVGPAVLIPRPETELLVEHALAALVGRAPPVQVLDLGTGSGCIAVAIASEMTRRSIAGSVVAVDESEQALKVAKRNAQTNGVVEQIRFELSDWCQGVSGVFDVIVSNPPYVEEGSREVSPDTKFEPPAALYAGNHGLEDILRIVGESPSLLKPGGMLLCEIGHQQGRSLAEGALKGLFADYGSYRIIKDLSGLDRVLELRAKRAS